MGLTLFSTLAVLGVIGGFAAGFLGVGGGILLFPLLLYVPPLVGLGSLDVKTVSALVISQVFFASLIGGSAHWRSGRVHSRLTFVAALTAAPGSFMGGISSRWVSEEFLLFLFGFITLLAAGLMFLPEPSANRDMAVEDIPVPIMLSGLLSFATGLIVGFLGAGNFVFVPLLIYVLGIPTRVAIGSNLIIAALSTFSGFLGKLIIGQIPFLMAVAVVVGAVLGALGGESAHGRASPRVLRYAYAAVIGVVAVRIWITLLL